METFGLVGFPLTQSFSQKYFSQKFEKEGRSAQYKNFEIDSIGEFPEIFDDSTIKGLNVTIPYKERVMPFVDELDPIAEKVGAVNVIKVSDKNGKLYLKGYNSDVFGFEESIKKYLKPNHTHALILGSGGASKAVRYVLKELGICFSIVSRRLKTDWLTYDLLTPELVKANQLIINTTPLGMFPNVEGFPNIPYQAITANHFVFDLIYNPEQTLFMKKCMDNGAVAVNGYEMLVKQAEKAWEIWNGIN